MHTNPEAKAKAAEQRRRVRESLLAGIADTNRRNGIGAVK